MDRVIFCLTLFLCVLSSEAIADPGSAASSGTELSQLERKYFEHTYDSDGVDVRVGRLEKMIYGDLKKGTTSDRLAKLVTLVEAEEATPLDGASAPAAPSLTPSINVRMAVAPDRSLKAQGAPGTEQVGRAADTNKLSPSTANNEEVAADNGDFSNYPHITALENELLGRAYPQDALSARLSRLELGVFGKGSPSNDLSSRTDALEKFAESKLHTKPFGVNPKMGGNDDDNTIVQGPAPVEPRKMVTPSERVEPPEVLADVPPPSSAQFLSRVGWCEFHVFGKTFPSLHLMGRLRQLHDELAASHSESNLELLDDMDSLTRAVQAHIQSKHQ